MVDTKFKAIVDHPEKRGIISRLVSGESPREISNYLKTKYKKDDEKHLRLPSVLLKEFIDTFGAHYGFAKAVIKKDADSKLDKQIAESLLENKEWRERVAEITDDEIDLKNKVKQLLIILEARTEQLFDLIQSNPENTKNDYVFNKYMELFFSAIEKADKLLNDKPDVKIEHTYTVQMVEQQSVAIQEAIRRVLGRMSPEHSAFFMDALQEEMSKMKPEYNLNNSNPNKRFENDNKDVNKLLDKAKTFEETSEGFLEDTGV